MGRIKLYTTLALLLLATQGKGQTYRVVFDKTTTAQVVQNTAWQEAAEQTHNISLDSVRSKKVKTSEYAATMYSLKELYKKSMQNVRGVDEETRIYKNIFSVTTEVLKNASAASQALYRNKKFLMNHAVCMNEIGNLFTETYSLINVYIKVVTSGGSTQVPESVYSFDPDELAISGKNGDGYNWMDRKQRYDLAMSIWRSLRTINFKLQAIIFKATYLSSLSNLLYTIDYENWAKIVTGDAIAKTIIRDWKGLKQW